LKAAVVPDATDRGFADLRRASGSWKATLGSASAVAIVYFLAGAFQRWVTAPTARFIPAFYKVVTRRNQRLFPPRWQQSSPQCGGGFPAKPMFFHSYGRGQTAGNVEIPEQNCGI
jgi:hypothetical protein